MGACLSCLCGKNLIPLGLQSIDFEVVFDKTLKSSVYVDEGKYSDLDWSIVDVVSNNDEVKVIKKDDYFEVFHSSDVSFKVSKKIDADGVRFLRIHESTFPENVSQPVLPPFKGINLDLNLLFQYKDINPVDDNRLRFSSVKAKNGCDFCLTCCCMCFCRPSH
jgi:hypothetical protein